MGRVVSRLERIHVFYGVKIIRLCANCAARLKVTLK